MSDHDPPRPEGPSRSTDDAADDAGGIEEVMPARRKQRLAPDTARELRSTGHAKRQGAASESAADAAIERIAVTADRREAVDLASPAPVTYADPGCARPFEMPPGATLRWIPDGIEVSVDGTTFLLRCVDGQWAQQEAGSAAERDQTSR